jgi:hypothetical protein
MRTGMPVEVRMVATSVGENSKLEAAFAEVNLASTRLGSTSDRPRSILMGRASTSATVVEEGKSSCPLRKDTAGAHRCRSRQTSAFTAPSLSSFKGSPLPSTLVCLMI